MGWVGGTEMYYSQDPNFWERQPINGRIIIIAEVLSKKQGVQASHQATQPGGCVPGRQAPRTSGL